MVTPIKLNQSTNCKILMKNMKSTLIYSSNHPLPMQPNNLFTGIRKGLKMLVLPMLLLLLSQFDASAQTCALNCKQNLQVSLGANCVDTITYDIMTSCPGPASNYMVGIMRSTGLQVPAIITGADIGQTLTVKLKRISPINECWGTIRVEDKLAPQLTCPPNTTFFCGTTPDITNTPRGTGRPTVLECSAFTLTFSDVNKSSSCLAPDTILRTFIATDIFGNVASCLQKIALIRPLVQSDSIKIKNDTFYGCALPMTSYVPPLTSCPFSTPLNAVTGLRDTIRFCRGNFCNILIDYSDIVDTLCSANTKKITRTWRILDGCTSAWVLKMQVILVLDTVPPVITMSGPDTIFSNTSFTACGAFLSIPPVLVTDACSSPVSVTATIFTPTCCSNPANIVGTVAVGSTPVIAPFLVPVDTHFIVYRATDLCGNFSTRSKVVIVRDVTPPVAICRTNTVVSLTSDTYSRVLATTFDEGSADNCCIGRFEVRRMVGETDADFKPYIDFTCADAATSCTNPTPIQVILRVFDCNGNFNSCMINVTVQDKVPPTISAPPSVTVDCGSYTFASNLTNAFLATNFGKVVIAPTAPSQVLVNIFGDGTNNNVLVGLDGVANDNCGVTVAPTFTNNLNSCGVGTIVRRWTATDPCGRTATASQTITVQNSTPFNGNTDIRWPEDFTTTLTNCTTANTAPSVTGSPVITSDGCDQVLTTYEDEIFNILPNSNTQSVCYKILRTWVVVDWCQANIPGVTWRYTYSQAIKVIDTTVPIINNCPTSDILVDIQNSGCTKDALTLPTITATDCPNQTLVYRVTTNFPAGTEGTDNNDKTFFNVPVGTYTAQYSVTDNCGNVAACNVNIIVRDRKKPTPVCFVATTALMMPPACMVRLDTFHINNRSYDNCTGESNLRIRMELGYQRPANPNFNPSLPVSTTNPRCLAPINPVPVSTNPLSLPTFVNIFPCDLQQNTAIVRMYVIDQAGNFDYCETQVAITNTNGCASATQAANVAGLIQTEQGDNVEQASVSIDMANALPFMTGANGAFNFNLPNTGNYTVNAEKDMHPLNGVTTYDLVLMSRHILGIEQLNSPYKMIAADINKSGTITTLDMVELRKLILRIDNNFTNNTSWRFVDKSFVFPNPSNPFASQFPEAHSVTAANMNDAINFVGVKIGDVNATASANTLLGTEEHNAVGTLNFNVADKSLQAGENVTVDFRAKDLRSAQGFQFTLNFDANALTFADVKTGELNGLTRENFGTTMANEGVITTSWNGAATSVKDEAVLFSLTFKVNHAIALSNAMHFNSRYTAAEAYNTQAELLDVNLQFNKSTGVVSANNFELYQNQPNPFNSKTTVGFNLPTAGDATLIIMDAAGRTLKTWTNGFAKGYNEFNINKSELDATGVLYYQLSTATNTATKKMIIIE